MFTRRLRILFLAFLMFPAYGLAQSAAVVPQDSAPLVLCSDCTSLTVLLKPSKATIHLDDQPQVSGVYLTGSKKDSDRFSAKWTGDKRPQAIVLTLDRESLARAGTYDLYLDLQPRTNPYAERLRLQIVHPEPKLKAVPKLMIDRTYILPGWTSDDLPQLTLYETTNQSNFSNVQFQKLTNATLGTKQIGGSLRILKPPSEIKSGTPVVLTYELQNDFGTGIATGNINVSAAEVSDSIGTIDFEVRSHLHWIYIGVTIFLGLLVSYLLKVKLQQRVELDQATLDSCKLLERVDIEEARHVDGTFRAAYRQAKDDLAAALKGSDPAAMNEKRTVLDASWRTALQALTTRHQEQETAFSKLDDIAGTDWLVPAPVSDVVAAVKTQLTSIRTLIDIDDLKEASIAMSNATTNLGDGIRSSALDWQARVGEILDTLGNRPAGVSKLMAEKLAKPVADLRVSVSCVTTSTLLETPEQIRQTLGEIGKARNGINQFSIWFKAILTTDRASIIAEVAKAKPSGWNADLFRGVIQAETELAAFIGTIGDAPVIENLPPLLGQLQAQWVDAIKAIFPASDENVQHLLAVQDYSGAVEAAISKSSGKKGPLGSAAGFAPSVTALQFADFSKDVFASHPSPIYSIRSYFQSLMPPDPVSPNSFTDDKRLKRDKLLQSIVIGIILIILGYSLQLSSFVGSFTDLSTLFFWAFGLDLTLDTVRSLSAKKT
jgi:hypothetical protein